MKWRNLAVLVGVVVLLVSYAYGQGPIYDRDPSGTDAFGIIHTEWEGNRATTDTATNLKSLDIDGNYVYAVGESLMATFSILYPLSPSLVNEYKLSGYDSLYFEDIEVRGNFAFIVGGYIDLDTLYGIILVLNIGFPGSPTFVDTITHENSYYTAIDLEGNIAYVTDSLGNFRSFDITTLTSISVIYNLVIDPGAHDLVVDGNIAYVANPIQIQSFNVAVPGSIAHINNSPRYSWVRDIYVDGDWLFAATNVGANYGLRKFSIENAIIDSSSADWWDYGHSYGVTVMGNWAYTVGYYFNEDTFSTLRGYDVTDSVDIVAKINFEHEALTRMQKNGETMIYAIGKYTRTNKGVLRAIRVAYPDSNVFDRGSIEFYVFNYGHPRGDHHCEPSQIEIRGNYAFIVDSMGMTTYNINYPDSCFFTGEHIDTSDSHRFYGINVSGNYTFLTSTDLPGDGRAFWIINTTDPSPGTPFQLPFQGSATPDSHTNIIGEVKIEGNVAYTYGIDSTSGNVYAFLDAFNIQNLSSPSWLSSDLMLRSRVNRWTFYKSFFGELQIEGDTIYTSWRQIPYDTITGGIVAQTTNHIAFFDVCSTGDVTAFLPPQIIDGGGGATMNHNMGCFRVNTALDYGGAIDVEGNIMYSTIGMTHQFQDPLWDGMALKYYGLIRYDVDTTYCGTVLDAIPPNYNQSVWIPEYLRLTGTNAAPLELYIDGDYAFCSFVRDSLYFMRVDSVDSFTPQYDEIPITNCTFNDFKPHGDYLFAISDSSTAITYYHRLLSIKVYKRNHD